MLFGLFSWWYTTGWLKLTQHMGERVQDALRFFSVGQLAGSLFSPFRQISAGGVKGSVGMRLRAWGDQLFSRVIGAIVRSLLILIGLLTALAIVLLGFALIIVWPLLPVLPLIGLGLSIGRVA